MSIIIRYLDISSSSFMEYFLGFLKVDDTSGKSLFHAIVDETKNTRLDLHDVRGQGYDNGSNMKASEFKAVDILLSSYTSVTAKNGEFDPDNYTRSGGDPNSVQDDMESGEKVEIVYDELINCSVVKTGASTPSYKAFDGVAAVSWVTVFQDLSCLIFAMLTFFYL
ncbi:zinc finger MYM-type protein 1-like protein [Tanacetum coccineum]